MPLLILFIIVLIGVLIKALSRPQIVVNINIPITETKTEETKTGTAFTSSLPIEYYDGPVPTKYQQEQIDKGIFEHIERFPNGILAERNPEYVDQYLDSIDLDLPPGITIEKKD